MKVYHISVKRPSNYSYSWSSTLSAPSTICTCPSTYFTTCLWTNFHDSVFIIFQMINSIFTIVAKYALVLLVLWRLRVEAGRHRNPSVGSHLRCRFVTLISFVFDPHHIFSVIFTQFFEKWITSASLKSHQQASIRISKSRYLVSNWSIVGNLKKQTKGP